MDEISALLSRNRYKGGFRLWKTSLAMAWANRLAAETRRGAWVSSDPEDNEADQAVLKLHAIKARAQTCRNQVLELEADCLSTIIRKEDEKPSL